MYVMCSTEVSLVCLSGFAMARPRLWLVDIEAARRRLARPRLWLVDIEAARRLPWRPFTEISQKDRESAVDWNPPDHEYEYRRFIKIFCDWDHDDLCFREEIDHFELHAFEVRRRVKKRLWHGGGYHNPKFRDRPDTPVQIPLRAPRLQMRRQCPGSTPSPTPALDAEPFPGA
jgi:hypothetical protein